MRESADRFASWADRLRKSPVMPSADSAKIVDLILDGLDAEGCRSEALVIDLASYIGEIYREKWGGEWTEDERFGYVVRGGGGMAVSRFMALAVAEKKLASACSFSMERFFATLAARLEAERAKAQSEDFASEVVELLAGKSGVEAMVAAQSLSEEFRKFWLARYGISLPLTLTGVREVDGFLRSHYYVNFLTDRRLISAGFYLGEVARGLFGGAWDFAGRPGIEKAALRHPEINYYPVGRIFKMMTERPEGLPLDEYIRLIPSARAELRRQGQSWE